MEVFQRLGPPSRRLRVGEVREEGFSGPHSTLQGLTSSVILDENAQLQTFLQWLIGYGGPGSQGRVDDQDQPHLVVTTVELSGESGQVPEGHLVISEIHPLIEIVQIDHLRIQWHARPTIPIQDLLQMGQVRIAPPGQLEPHGPIRRHLRSTNHASVLSYDIIGGGTGEDEEIDSATYRSPRDHPTPRGLGIRL